MDGIVKHVAVTVVLLALLGVAACGGEAPVPVKTWVGKWVLSVEDSVAVAERMARVQGLRMDENHVRQQGEVIGDILRDHTSAIHLHDDGTWRGVVSGPEKGRHESAGTWQVELGHLFLYVTEKDGAPERDGIFTHVFARHRSMIWQIQYLLNGIIPVNEHGISDRIIHRLEE